MARRRKERRQSHGSAWHWKQTDAWYYTRPGTKQRVPLFDEQGNRLRGKDQKEVAEIALAREKLSWQVDDGIVGQVSSWPVARVCAEYLQHCKQSVAKGTMSASHYRSAKQWLTDLCSYCGGLPVLQLKKGDVQKWLESHSTWKSPATIAAVIAVILAAFNRSDELFGLSNPLKGLKKPKAQPRLASFSPALEQQLYDATESCFANFLRAAIGTGLRPYCELARLKAEDVEETERGMMWRVYSSKTKKIRKIPIRPEIATLTRELMKSTPRGSGLPIFRNTKGTPWKATAGVVRFIGLKVKLGWDKDPIKKNYSSYTCRHTFVHRMLSGYWTGGNGCSIETLAELIGDTPKVAFEHYGREWGQHYQDPLWNAIGETTAAVPRARKAMRKAQTKQPGAASRRRVAASTRVSR